jgi:hypothetical protein
MAATGIIETIARGDLEVLLDEVSRHYQPGALEALADADPAWRGAVDHAEREAARLYEALREADLTLAQWRQRVADLRRLWERATASGAPPLPALDDVA